MMYEPPNRGGKTYQALNRTPSGDNDPAALTDPNVLANSFLWPQGYTTVWSGWENNLAPLDPVPPSTTASLTASAELPIARGPSGQTITGPGLRIHRDRGEARSRCSIPPLQRARRRPTQC